jgi:hypothetical protein
MVVAVATQGPAGNGPPPRTRHRGQIVPVTYLVRRAVEAERAIGNQGSRTIESGGLNLPDLTFKSR